MFIEQNATLIQKLGFTSKTGIFMIYDRLPDYIAVLINSYFDYGFLSKVSIMKLFTKNQTIITNGMSGKM